MPKKVYQGVNSDGNKYTVYDNGGFRYVNTNDAGKTQSTYFDTGKGHGFYKKNSPDGYAWHENQNQGTRNIIEKKPKAEKKVVPSDLSISFAGPHYVTEVKFSHKSNQ